MNKSTLLDMLEANHERFVDVLAKVSVERMQRPLAEDVQSGKDIVAHVTAWQRRLLNWFEVVRQGGTPHSPEPGMTWEDMDQLNEQTAQRDKHRPLQEVMADFHAAFQEFLSLIQSFSEEELNAAYPFAWGELNRREDSRPLWVSALAGPGYAHYQDHFYDLLLRLEPSQRCKPDPEKLASHIGTYTSHGKAPFTFSVVDGQLVAHRKGQTYSSLAFDETRFAFKDLGLITFDLIRDGTVQTLEWWTWIFVRQK